MVRISTVEARNHFSHYISMVEQQHEKIVVEKRGKKVALIIPFPETSEHPVSSILSIAALDAFPSQSDRFAGIVKEADISADSAFEIMGIGKSGHKKTARNRRKSLSGVWANIWGESKSGTSACWCALRDAWGSDIDCNVVTES